MKITFTNIKWKKNDGHLPSEVTIECTDYEKETIDSITNDSEYDDCPDAYFDDIMYALGDILDSRYQNSNAIVFEYDIKGD